MTSLRTRQRLVQYLRRGGIRHERVLDVLLSTPRHLFVEEALASHAYENTALPIGFGQTISQPYIVARMSEALLDGHAPRKILEVGTGSGYQTAVLAALVEQVFSVERIGRLVERSRERLRALGLTNVRLKHGDGSQGWSEHRPYDGILVTAASAQIPQALLQQLALGGRLVLPVGPDYAQQLLLVERRPIGFKKRGLGPVSFVPLLEGIL